MASSEALDAARICYRKFPIPMARPPRASNWRFVELVLVPLGWVTLTHFRKMDAITPFNLRHLAWTASVCGTSSDR